MKSWKRTRSDIFLAPICSFEIRNIFVSCLFSLNFNAHTFGSDAHNLRRTQKSPWNVSLCLWIFAVVLLFFLLFLNVTPSNDGLCVTNLSQKQQRTRKKPINKKEENHVSSSHRYGTIKGSFFLWNCGVSSPLRTLSILNFYEHSNKSPKLFHMSTGIVKCFLFLHVHIAIISVLSAFRYHILCCCVTFLQLEFLCEIYAVRIYNIRFSLLG